MDQITARRCALLCCAFGTTVTLKTNTINNVDATLKQPSDAQGWESNKCAQSNLNKTVKVFHCRCVKFFSLCSQRNIECLIKFRNSKKLKRKYKIRRCTRRERERKKEIANFLHNFQLKAHFLNCSSEFFAYALCKITNH